MPESSRTRHARHILVCAVGLALCVAPAAHAQAPQPGPVNQAPPTIKRSGDTLSTDSGQWVGAQNYTYDWLRCSGTATSSCGAPVSGAIEPSYRLSSADAERYLRVRVTASNSSGSNSSVSEPFGPIEGAPAATLLRPFPIVVLTGRERGALTTITKFVIKGGPQGAGVLVRCIGRGCPFRRRLTNVPARRRLRIRAAERTYRAGAVIEVSVTAPRRIGKFTRVRIRRDRVPSRTDSCLQPGARRPSRCP